ncbi:MAG: sulfur transferase domain-containing protein [Acidobacteriota bacterium]|nr:sulfur transferase domain-containing protein [Acidobacteriota bacterium]
MTWKTCTLSLILAVAWGCQQHAAEVHEASPPSSSAAAPLGAGSTAAAPELLPNQKTPLEGIISGGQPMPEQLRAARDAGYKTVINLRRPSESGVGNEPEIVAGLGMEYLSIPIDDAAGLTKENTAAFTSALESAEYPIVLHCSSGNRIGALFALKAYWIDGKNAEEALEIGLAAGLTRLETAVEKILEGESGT